MSSPEACATQPPSMFRSSYLSSDVAYSRYRGVRIREPVRMKIGCWVIRSQRDTEGRDWDQGRWLGIGKAV